LLIYLLSLANALDFQRRTLDDNSSMITVEMLSLVI